jgi:hypothetical protein
MAAIADILNFGQVWQISSVPIPGSQLLHAWPMGESAGSTGSAAELTLWGQPAANDKRKLMGKVSQLLLALFYAVSRSPL